MPSLVDNQVRWTEHPWDREGHEWSPGGTAAGGDMFWWRGLLPRIHRHLPAGRVLEIAPGFGRWTSHLVSHARHLIIVDLTERCIEHCRQRFADRTNIECWTNDGESLEMVEDESLDFVFSFDSLVHAEAPVLRAYLRQLGRKLRPGGTGFIHHSNLHAMADANGRIPAWVTRRNWRGETMSARLFRDYCDEAGLECQAQEIVNWISRSRKADRHRLPGTGIPLTDAFSTFMRPLSAARQPTRIYVNPSFAEEWRQCVVLASVYGERAYAPRAFANVAAAPPPTVRSEVGLVARAKDRVRRMADHYESLLRERAVARQVRRNEPIVNAVRAGRCPDCSSSLASDGLCARCHVTFHLRG